MSGRVSGWVSVSYYRQRYNYVVNEDVDTGQSGHVSAWLHMGFTGDYRFPLCRCIWPSLPRASSSVPVWSRSSLLNRVVFKHFY